MASSVAHENLFAISAPGYWPANVRLFAAQAPYSPAQ